MVTGYFVDVGALPVEYRMKFYSLPYVWSREKDILLFRVLVDKPSVSLYSSDPSVSAVITNNAIQEGLDIRVFQTTGTGPGYIVYPEDETFYLYPGDYRNLWNSFILSLRDFSIFFLRKCGLPVYSYAVDPRVIVYGDIYKIVASLGVVLDARGREWGALFYKFKWDSEQFRRVFDVQKATQSCAHLVEIGKSYEDVWTGLERFINISKQEFVEKFLSLFSSRYGIDFIKLHVDDKLNLV